MSVGCIAMGDRTDLSGLHCHLKPCWWPWAMLLRRAVSGSVVLLRHRAVFMICAGHCGGP